MRITRVKVVRLLKEAREAGAVEIHIDCDKILCFELEVELRELTGLKAVMVVPSGPDPTEAAAAGGAIRFEQALGEAGSIAIGVGRTLTSVAKRAARVKHLKTKYFASMGGFSTDDARYDPMAIAQIITNKYNVPFYQIKAPILADSPEITAALKRTPAVASAIEMVINAEIAFVSVTSVENSMYFYCGLISQEEREKFLAQGLVGEMGGHFFSLTGEYSDETSSRFVLVPLALNGLVVAVAGDREKVPALAGVIRSGCIDELVTDEDTASALVEQFRGKAQRKNNAKQYNSPT